MSFIDEDIRFDQNNKDDLYTKIKDLLKGNYKMDTKVVDDKGENTFDDSYKKKALASIGGSMVFVERKKLYWDGNDD